MTDKKTTAERTPTAQIEDALYECGYRQLAHYPCAKSPLIGHRLAPQRPIAFTLYTDGRHVLVLQRHMGGGCELYRPVYDGLGLAETIAAIPVLTSDAPERGDVTSAADAS